MQARRVPLSRVSRASERAVGLGTDGPPSKLCWIAGLLSREVVGLHMVNAG